MRITEPYPNPAAVRRRRSRSGFLWLLGLAITILSSVAFAIMLTLWRTSWARNPATEINALLTCLLTPLAAGGIGLFLVKAGKEIEREANRIEPGVIPSSKGRLFIIASSLSATVICCLFPPYATPGAIIPGWMWAPIWDSPATPLDRPIAVDDITKFAFPLFIIELVALLILTLLVLGIHSVCVWFFQPWFFPPNKARLAKQERVED